ncbi:MAG: hypothetical protein ACP5E5_13725 [Acidobacteriaceae bacterium]
MIAQTEARTRLFPLPSMQCPARSIPLAAAAALLLLGLGGCKSHSSNYVSTAQIDNGIDNGSDPALANLAPASSAPGVTQVLGANYSYSPQQQSESYPSQSPAPIVSGYNGPDQPYQQADQSAMPGPDQAPPPGGYPGYGQQPMPGPGEPPPPLPEYDRPPCPGPNYLWTPGYWAWGPYGYY